MAAIFSFDYDVVNKVHKTKVWIGKHKNGSLLNWFILIVKSCALTPLTAGWAYSGFKTAEDYLDIQIVDSSVFIMPAH